MLTIKTYIDQSGHTTRLPSKHAHGRLFRVQLSIGEGAMEAFGSWPIQKST